MASKMVAIYLPESGGEEVAFSHHHTWEVLF